MDYILIPTLSTLDLSEELKLLSGKLISLQDLLKRLDVRKFASIDELKSDLASIIDAAHVIDDATDNSALKKVGTINFIKRLAFRNDIDVTKIQETIDRFIRNFQNRMLTENSSFSPRQTGEPKPCNKPPLDLIGLGLTYIEEKVVHSLLDVTVNPFVSICGAPGAGKTTLANQVYHNTMIRSHFDYFAWLNFHDLIEFENDYVAFDDLDVPGHVYLEILRSLMGEKMDDYVIPAHLARPYYINHQLEKFLQNNKCLVVVDEKFSSCGLWKCVVNLFPGHADRPLYSKFLLISSSNLLNDARVIEHELRHFSSDESWNLLQTIMSSVNDCSDFDMQLEEIGRNIAHHLNGSPWAIMLAGGLLAAKQCPIEWQRVDDILVSDIDIDKDPFHDLLMLSYIDLPARLKPCLFYLSQFPEGYEIDVRRLVRLWIAEGFVSSRVLDTAKEGETSEDLAESYLIELISRFLVLVGDRDANLRVETCHLPETVRSLCLSKPRLIDLKDDLIDVNFFIHQYAQCYQFPTSVGAEMRSLLYFPGRNFGLSYYLNFDKHKLLRVLDLEEADFNEESLPKSIGELVHLRYLSLRRAKISKIPSTLGNLKFLQTLDLLIEGKSVYIPDVIWKLNRLRHLFLPEVCDTKVKLRLDTLTNLRTLENFPARNSDVKDLYVMMKLRELSIRDALSIRNFSRFSKLIGMRLEHLQRFCLHDSSKEGDKGAAAEYEDLLHLGTP